ncbi:MAG TPA: ADP-dependent glucokinase/phosphofructokinase [Acidisoma sp.]|nr:ADP-dependent glucokinase/phosphofructokinase [Acidisoma sp.]
MHNPWQDSYRALLNRLDIYAARAGWTMCGLSLCVDAFTQLDDTCCAQLAAGPDGAQALSAELRRRAAAGIGGEIRFNWPDGPAWLDANLPLRAALGGTPAHAAKLLTRLGAPALLALEHRSPEQIAVLDADMLLAAEEPIRAAEVQPQGIDRMRVYVFEYTAGDSVAGAVPPRSSRIIVRFHDFDLERDTHFARLAPRLLRANPGRGSGILAGFNSLGEGMRLESGLRYGRGIAADWKAAGIGVIHVEMAGYETPAGRERALNGLAGSMTSLGMSLSEFRAIDPEAPSLAEGLCRLATRLGLSRISVHADDWAISATRHDPDQEREALMMGCLLASARAAAGGISIPSALPAGAHFAEPPPEESRGEWHIVSCPSPHLPRPRATLGLGDTFMAGCLLVLGQPKLPDLSASFDRTTNLAPSPAACGAAPHEAHSFSSLS